MDQCGGQAGFRLALACPEGYDPDQNILARSQREAPGRVSFYRGPAEAVAGADILYSDDWASMGQEAEQAVRVEAFKGYQINQRLVDLAAGDVLVMHCLPAHRGRKSRPMCWTGKHSIVFDQAENRLHVQKAIMEMLMKGEK